MKKIILSIFITFMGLFGVMAAPALAYTCPDGTLREKANVSNPAECNTEAKEDDDSLIDTIGKILNVALGLIGLLAVIMMIYGGFMYMTSAGDANKVTKAKNTIIYGVVGLVIAVLSFAIVTFVLGALGEA